VVTAVGFEAERRHATGLAEGIDSEAQLATARAAGATLGQGFMLGEPGPLPNPLPEPGRPLRLAGTGGAPDGPLPYQRVTNWRRPTRG
jgi:EAL domain-containing protein (putative c-di-GMP-specific phosphodiesterase class I)